MVLLCSRSWNLTAGCFAQFSGGCESAYYNENFKITEAFLISLTGSECTSGSLCWTNQAIESLSYLTALINTEMATSISNMPRYLMPKANKDILCG